MAERKSTGRPPRGAAPIHQLRPPPEPETPEYDDTQPSTDPHEQVRRLAGVGLKPQDIAYIMGLPLAKILGDYAHDMNVGISQANMRVANALFATATDRTHKGHPTCSIYWSKARMGWAETSARSAEDTPEGGAHADASHLIDGATKDRFAETMSALRNAKR